MLRPTDLGLALSLAAAFALCGCAPSIGGDRADYLGRGRQDGQAIVTAESRYGSATVSGAVRQGGSGGLEVRLPGGTWVDCHQSCSETLRRESVDFWQNHGNGPRDNGPDGPGYFLWRR